MKTGIDLVLDKEYDRLTEASRRCVLKNHLNEYDEKTQTWWCPGCETKVSKFQRELFRGAAAVKHD